MNLPSQDFLTENDLLVRVTTERLNLFNKKKQWEGMECLVCMGIPENCFCLAILGLWMGMSQIWSPQIIEERSMSEAQFMDRQYRESEKKDFRNTTSSI